MVPNLFIIYLLYFFVNVLYYSTDMKLIVGLGNPEEKYKNTRHNVGFTVVAHYASEHAASFRLKEKFMATVAELTVEGEKTILVLPNTYYNLSGKAVRAVADFYKVEPADVLVVHDELALPFGTIRTRLGGSPAGNNGIKSVTEHLGPDTARLRVGVYNDLRDRIDDADFVLGTFTKQESEQLVDIRKKAADIIDSFIRGTFEHTTHN